MKTTSSVVALPTNVEHLTAAEMGPVPVPGPETDPIDVLIDLIRRNGVAESIASLAVNLDQCILIEDTSVDVDTANEMQSRLRDLESWAMAMRRFDAEPAATETK
jgi:hypothetical protein